MSVHESDSEVSIFKPKGRSMRGEVRVISLVLAGWLLSIVGSQLLVFLLGGTAAGRQLDELTFFNLPVHFWFTGQFLPLWFIILCALFNVWMDRHSERSLDGALRFMMPGARKGEGE